MVAPLEAPSTPDWMTAFEEAVAGAKLALAADAEAMAGAVLGKAQEATTAQIAEALAPVTARVEEGRKAAISAVQAVQQLAAQPPPEIGAPLLAALRAISMVVATRVLLFLSVMGAFILAILTAQQQSYLDLGLLTAWCALVNGPLCWLETRRRPSSES